MGQAGIAAKSDHLTGEHPSHALPDVTSRKTPEHLPHKQGQRTIRFRLTWLVLACVLPVCMAAGILLYYSYQYKRALTEKRVLETARALSMVVDQQFAAMQAFATSLATSPFLVSGDMAAFSKQTRTALQGYPDYVVSLSDGHGQELVNTAVPFGTPLPTRGALDVMQSVFATGRPALTNLYRGTRSGLYVFGLHVPVFRDGRVVYDLEISEHAENFQKTFLQQHIPPEWTNAILDANHVLVARSRLPEASVGKLANPILVKRMTEAQEGTVEQPNQEGVGSLLMFHQSTASGWSVAIGIPKAVMWADTRQWLMWMVGGAILLLITGIALALFLAERITGSIRALIAPALALGTGEPVDVGQLDLAETNELGQSLVKASQLLQQHTAERERLLAQLEQQSKQLQEIIDGATDTLVFVKDTEGRFLTANTAFEKLLQIKRDALRGKTDGDLISKDRADTYRAVDAQVLKTGQPIQIEETALLADGKEHVFLANKFPLFDATGKPYAVCAISADITERKQVEASLKADISALTQMHELSGKVLGAKGIQPLLQDVMDAALAITKADHGTLQLREGDSLRIVAHHGHQTPFLDFFASAENRASGCGAAMLSGERVVVPDIENSSLFLGTPSLPVLREAGVRAVQSTPLVSRTGVLLGILTTQWSVPYCPSEHDLWRIDLLARQAADLIEHANTEQTIAHLASFPELNPNPIFETDLEGKVTYANPAAQKLFPNLLGCGPGHPLLAEWSSVVVRLTTDCEETIVRQIEIGDRVFHETIHCPRNLRVVRSYFADITARKRAEEALLRSEKLASVGRMAVTVSHEINNPLGAITNLLFLLSSVEGLPESARQYLEVADAELRRIAHITRQSLGFYRESNAPALMSVNAVLESAVDLLKSKVKAKQAVIEKQWDGDVQITAVAGELRQVFSNLLSNSLDAIEEQGVVKLRVSTGAAFKNGHGHVRVTVADNGKGIDASLRSHVFEPFFTTKGTVGTGLGLWVSKQIIGKHGGTIRMRSSSDEARRGTVFSVVLPVEPATAAFGQAAGV